MKTAKDQRRQVALFSAYFVSPVEARAPQLAKTYLQQICLSGLGVDVVASAQHQQTRAPPPPPHPTHISIRARQISGSNLIRQTYRQTVHSYTAQLTQSHP